MAQLRKSDQWNTKQLSYAVRAKDFVRRTISIRKRIVKLQKSQKPSLEVEKAINYLSAWFDAPINSISSAKIILKNYDKVLLLLPGKEAKNYESLLQEFQHLLNEAAEILGVEYNVVYHERTIPKA